MKTKNYFVMLFAAFLAVAGLTGCSDDNEEGRKVTNHQEYELTVASKKVLGTTYSCGNRHISPVYAVKKNRTQDWEPLFSIQDFDYEEGYEYRIKISETSYLDYSMGEPAWTEYKLMEVILKEKVESEGMPADFLPDGYACLDVDVRYVIEADKKDEVEEELKNRYLFLCKQYVFNKEFTEFAIINDDHEYFVLANGKLNRTGDDDICFPESYKLIPLEGQVAAKEQWTFLIGHATQKKTVLTMDAFFVVSPGDTGNGDGARARIWLYQDLTQAVRAALPDAGVKTVVLAQVFKDIVSK